MELWQNIIFLLYYKFKLTASMLSSGYIALTLQAIVEYIADRSALQSDKIAWH